MPQSALRSQQDALTRQWEGERAKLAAIQARTNPPLRSNWRSLSHTISFPFPCLCVCAVAEGGG
jgi:hypothetical protein